MTRPLNTDVIANDTPVTVPTMPLARSRRSSGTSSVTHVDRAMPRICPATDPTSVAATSSQNHGLRQPEQLVGVDGHEDDRRPAPKHTPDTEVASTIAVCLRWWST